MVELEPFVEPEPLVEIEHDPTPLPEPDSNLMSKLEPSPESVATLVPKSTPEDVSVLHDYLDPFLPPKPDIPAFKTYFDELLPWWIIYLLPIASFARSAMMGLHHHLLETRLCNFHYINSRTSFSHQRSLMEIGRAHV